MNKENNFTKWEIVVILLIISSMIYFAWRYSDDEKLRRGEITQEQYCVNNIYAYNCLRRKEPAKVESKTITLVKEYEDCKKWGGSFLIQDNEIRFGDSHVSYDLFKKEIMCKKKYTEGNKEILETLFDYNLY